MHMNKSLKLVVPSLDYLPAYIAALKTGWSVDNLRPEVAIEELAKIEKDAAEFLRSKNDRDASGGPITLPDGSVVPRIPGFNRWMWDGEFCGSIGFRWQPGTTALPPHCLGHIGYSVVPWKRGTGCATRALGLMLDEARKVGLPFVELTTDPANIASQKVIAANGGVLHEEFIKPPQFGGVRGLRYRIVFSHVAE